MLQQAARINDPIGHGYGMLGMISGALFGAIAGALFVAGTVATGGLFAVVIVAGAIAGGGLAGGALARGIQRAADLPYPVTGNLANGSLNVRIGGLPAARAGIDYVNACDGLRGVNHFPELVPSVAEGSRTVGINSQPAARVSDRLVCGGVITIGHPKVYVGGEKVQVLSISDTEEMFEKGLQILGLLALGGGAVLAAAAGAAALTAFAAINLAGYAGFAALGKIGESIGPGYRDILQGTAGILLVGAAGIEGFRGVQAKAEALALDERYDGHVTARHGPELSDAELKARLTKGETPGAAPDASLRSAPPASTRFKSYGDQVETQKAALEKFAKDNNLDLAKGPANPSAKYDPVEIDHGRPIDDGFVGIGERAEATDLKSGDTIKVYGNTQPVSGITRTFTRVKWDPDTSQWVIKQHFPKP